MKLKFVFLSLLFLVNGLSAQLYLSRYVKNYPVSNYNSNFVSAYIRLSNNHFLITGRATNETSFLRLLKDDSVQTVQINTKIGFLGINYDSPSLVRKANLLELNGLVYLNDMSGLYQIEPNLGFVNLLNQQNTGELIYNVKDMAKAGNNLFLATWQGLYKFDGNQFSNLSTLYGLNFDTLKSIHKINETELAISSKSGLYLFDVTNNSRQLLVSYQTESPFNNFFNIYRISDGTFRVISQTKKDLYKIDSNSITEFPFYVKDIQVDTIQSNVNIDNFVQIGDDVYFENATNYGFGDPNIYKLMPNGEFKFHFLDGIIPVRYRNNSGNYNDYENPAYYYLHYQALIKSFEQLNSDSLGIFIRTRSENFPKSSFCAFHKDYLHYLFNDNNNDYTFVDGYLDINNLKTFSNYHFKHNFNSNKYFYSYREPFGVIFNSFGLQNGLNKKRQFSNSSNLIIAGLDEDNNIRKMGKFDFFDVDDSNPGPIIPNLSIIEKEKLLDKYRRVWKINRSDIEKFRTDFENQIINQPGYYINESILSWPGNPEIGGTQNMAPYVDVNGDGFYNPYDGDYPEITGDQMLYFVYNDEPFILTEELKPMQLEVHCIMYAFACDSIQNPINKTTTNQTIFTKYRVVNKSENTYSNLYWGSNIYAQNNGGRNDNQIGSRPDKNLAFTWTNDIDVNDNFPIYNLIVLDGPEAIQNDSIDNNNNGVIDEEDENCLLTGNIVYSPGSGNEFYGYPYSGEEYYRYLTSRWRNGAPLMRGNNGIFGNEEAKFIFDGAPFCSNEWNDCNLTYFGLYNRKAMISSSGPFNLLPNQEIQIEFAEYMYYNPTVSHSPTTTWVENLAHVDFIKEAFYQNSLSGCNQSLGYHSIPINNLELTCYPNPAGATLSFALSRPLKKDFILQVFDIYGRSILNKTYSNQIHFDEINVNHLPNGIYIIKISNHEVSTAQRFVVNH